jgi:hypothetical protein
MHEKVALDEKLPSLKNSLETLKQLQNQNFVEYQQLHKKIPFIIIHRII